MNLIQIRTIIFIMYFLLFYSMTKEYRVIPLRNYTIHELHSKEDAVREAVKNGSSPTTIIFACIDPPAVSISRKQDLKKDVDIELCERIGVHIARRDRSGRTVNLDRNYLIVSLIGRVSDLALRPGKVRDMFAYFGNIFTYSLQEILGVTLSRNLDNDVMIDGKKIGGLSADQREGVTVVHGFLRYDKRWELPLQYLRIDGVPLFPYLDRVNEITTAVREFSDIEYHDFYERFMKYFLVGVRYRSGDFTDEETRLAKMYMNRHQNKEWIYGNGRKDLVSRGHCDIIAGKKLKIEELEGLVKFE